MRAPNVASGYSAQDSDCAEALLSNDGPEVESGCKFPYPPLRCRMQFAGPVLCSLRPTVTGGVGPPPNVASLDPEPRAGLFPVVTLREGEGRLNVLGKPTLNDFSRHKVFNRKAHRLTLGLRNPEALDNSRCLVPLSLEESKLLVRLALRYHVGSDKAQYTSDPGLGSL